jgi:exopolysaccharide biosynthesis polyprenyl glycosylphosphotransferase
MLKDRRIRDTRVYQVGDFLAASVAWAVFYTYRKSLEIEPVTTDLIFADPNFWAGVLLIPLAWVMFYLLFDRYRDIYRLSRLATFIRTFFISLLGVTVLFFTLILDDVVSVYTTYYRSFLVLFGLHFSITVLFRMILLTKASRKLKAGKVGYNTLIIGGNQRALELFEDITNRSKSLGYMLRGYVSTNGDNEPLMGNLPLLGKVSQLREVIVDYGIEDVIIATEAKEQERLRGIVDILFEFGDKLLVRIIPDMYDILLGNVRMNNVYGAVVIEIRQHLISSTEAVIKRFLDILVSGIAILFLLPIYAYIAIRTRMSSDGPIFYKQERVGRFGKSFHIIKFRSMFTNAEDAGPQLSNDHDPRITPWGRVMRKWRLDELPQFWNVLKGEMSLVGPRPERQHFIDLIMTEAPHYRHLLKVRPGITSWGQVKYGYASNLEQMIARLRFDILYIENMSLALDVKIIFYTVVVLFQGQGK